MVHKLTVEAATVRKRPLNERRWGAAAVFAVDDRLAASVDNYAVTGC